MKSFLSYGVCLAFLLGTFATYSYGIESELSNQQDYIQTQNYTLVSFQVSQDDQGEAGSENDDPTSFWGVVWEVRDAIGDWIEENTFEPSWFNLFPPELEWEDQE